MKSIKGLFVGTDSTKVNALGDLSNHSKETQEKIKRAYVLAIQFGGPFTEK